MKIALKCLLVFTLFISSFAKESVFNYSQALDVINYFDYLSKEYGSIQDGRYQDTWIKENGEFSSVDKDQLKTYRDIRKKYHKGPGEFDKFSIAFFRAKSLDDGLAQLAKSIPKEEVKQVATFLKHFKDRAAKFIKQSQGFSGKIEAIETKYKRLKLFKSFDQTFKFFDLKKSYYPKIFFVWAPTLFDHEIEYYQNIIVFKINPIEDIDSLFTERYLLDLMVNALFKSLSKTQFEAFTKTLNQSCDPKAYSVLKYVLGPMHFEYFKDPKKFDAYINHFSDKASNQMALNFHSLYEHQLKLKLNFFGSFANKIEYLCSLSK